MYYRYECENILNIYFNPSITNRILNFIPIPKTYINFNFVSDIPTISKTQLNTILTNIIFIKNS
jgi:hypothetical protein